MGLCGLSLAWHRAQPLMGDTAGILAALAGGLAAGVFVVLATASVWRAWRHPEAWAEDRRHAVRHPFLATVPVSLVLLATVATAQWGAGPAQTVLWLLGSTLQCVATAWVLARWWQAWRGRHAGSKHGLGVTPLLLIPIVGNVLVPLAGLPLGFGTWSMVQFAVGLALWPVLVMALAWRVKTHGLWPERLRPSVFILIAPPAVVALALLQWGAPVWLAGLLWVLALGFAALAALQLRAISQQALGLPHWALSFPMAAWAALTLRLATPGSAWMLPAMALLAAATLVVLGLLVGTVRGLRQGTLLVPEPVASLQVAPQG